MSCSSIKMGGCAVNVFHFAAHDYTAKKEKDAVRVIERNWCSYRDHQMFKLLKYAICAAEHSLTYEILRKVSPVEADLLRDPVFQPKVKFRFAGNDFPPYIVFKVYIQSCGKGLKYISGKRTIKPASEAAADACKQMGNRKYYDQMLRDLYQIEKDKITDEIDVTNLKEYMQYLKNTDELPASLGGKDNSWRKLSLEVLPRHNIMYDIMTFVTSGFASPRLSSEMPHIVATRPTTQENQLEMLRNISSGRSRKLISIEKQSGRRTKKARDRVEKMRQMYGLSEKQIPGSSSGIQETPGEKFHQKGNYDYVNDYVDDNEDVDIEDNWEGEGKSLYEWSQNLSLEAANFMSP